MSIATMPEDHPAWKPAVREMEDNLNSLQQEDADTFTAGWLTGADGTSISDSWFSAEWWDGGIAGAAFNSLASSDQDNFKIDTRRKFLELGGGELEAYSKGYENLNSARNLTSAEKENWDEINERITGIREGVIYSTQHHDGDLDAPIYESGKSVNTKFGFDDDDGSAAAALLGAIQSNPARTAGAFSAAMIKDTPLALLMTAAATVTGGGSLAVFGAKAARIISKIAGTLPKSLQGLKHTRATVKVGSGVAIGAIAGGVEESLYEYMDEGKVTWKTARAGIEIGGLLGTGGALLHLALSKSTGKTAAVVEAVGLGEVGSNPSRPAGEKRSASSPEETRTVSNEEVEKIQQAAVGEDSSTVSPEAMEIINKSGERVDRETLPLAALFKGFYDKTSPYHFSNILTEVGATAKDIEALKNPEVFNPVMLAAQQTMIDIATRKREQGDASPIDFKNEFMPVVVSNMTAAVKNYKKASLKRNEAQALVDSKVEQDKLTEAVAKLEKTISTHSARIANNELGQVTITTGENPNRQNAIFYDVSRQDAVDGEITPTSVYQTNRLQDSPEVKERPTSPTPDITISKQSQNIHAGQTPYNERTSEGGLTENEARDAQERDDLRNTRDPKPSILASEGTKFNRIREIFTKVQTLADLNEETTSVVSRTKEGKTTYKTLDSEASRQANALYGEIARDLDALNSKVGVNTVKKIVTEFTKTKPFEKEKIILNQAFREGDSKAVKAHNKKLEVAKKKASKILKDNKADVDANSSAFMTRLRNFILQHEVTVNTKVDIDLPTLIKDFNADLKIKGKNTQAINKIKDLIYNSEATHGIPKIEAYLHFTIIRKLADIDVGRKNAKRKAKGSIPKVSPTKLEAELRLYLNANKKAPEASAPQRKQQPDAEDIFKTFGDMEVEGVPVRRSEVPSDNIGTPEEIAEAVPPTDTGDTGGTPPPTGGAGDTRGARDTGGTPPTGLSSSTKEALVAAAVGAGMSAYADEENKLLYGLSAAALVFATPRIGRSSLGSYNRPEKHARATEKVTEFVNDQIRENKAKEQAVLLITTTLKEGNIISLADQAKLMTLREDLTSSYAAVRDVARNKITALLDSDSKKALWSGVTNYFNTQGSLLMREGLIDIYVENYIPHFVKGKKDSTGNIRELTKEEAQEAIGIVGTTTTSRGKNRKTLAGIPLYPTVRALEDANFVVMKDLSRMIELYDSAVQRARLGKATIGHLEDTHFGVVPPKYSELLATSKRREGSQRKALDTSLNKEGVSSAEAKRERLKLEKQLRKQYINSVVALIRDKPEMQISPYLIKEDLFLALTKERHDSIENSILYKSHDHPSLRGYKIHNSVYDVIKEQFHVDEVKSGWSADSVLKLNASLKRIFVFGSMFHGQALVMSGVYAMGPAQMLKALRQKGKITDDVDWNQLETGTDQITILMSEAIRQGLMAGNTKMQALVNVGKRELDEALEKFDDVIGVKTVKKGFDTIDKVIWVRLHDRFKLAAFLRQKEINIKAGMTDTAAGKASATFVNDAFGSLDWNDFSLKFYKYAADNPTSHFGSLANWFGDMTNPQNRKWLNMIAFAPDWTTSNIRILGKGTIGSILARGKIYSDKIARGETFTKLTKAEKDIILFHKQYEKYAGRAVLYTSMLQMLIMELFSAEGEASMQSLEEFWIGENSGKINFNNEESMVISKQVSEFIHMFQYPQHSALNKMAIIPKTIGEMLSNTAWFSLKKGRLIGPAITKEGESSGMPLYLLNKVLPITIKPFTEVLKNDDVTLLEAAKKSMFGFAGFPLYSPIGSTIKARLSDNDKLRLKLTFKKLRESDN